jgi:hypothetical protein
MTQWGQEAMEVDRVFGAGSPESVKAWQEASVRFANAAAGKVHVFSSAPFTNFKNVWFNYEFPEVANNPNIKSAVFHLSF